MDSKTAANLKLPADLDPSRLPRHVAIIMDGNGRWAESRGMRRLSGHRRGKDSVKAIVEASRELGIEFLSLYAFSSENWQRPETEVSGLMRLLKQYLTNELDRMMQNGVRLRVIGNVQRLPADVQRALQRVVRETLDNTGLTVTLALSYSAREEIVAAVRAIACKVRDGELAPESIDEALVTRSLGTAGIPDPDLLIRTSGEVRLSNFLLWQVAYTEIYITETLWPDFREKEFLEALRQFQARERRFGRVVEKLPEPGPAPSRVRGSAALRAAY